MFDETNEVHFDTSYSISLFKINSKDFKIKFKNKIQEWFDSKNDDYLYLSDFLNWLGYDEYEIYLETLIDLYKRFGGDVNNLETIFDEENITIGGNLISWYSYDILDEEYPQIGFRKLEVK